jgi:phosphoglycolate phosphatase
MLSPVLLKPSAIYFDFDNTLVDTWQIVLNGINDLMAAFNRPLWSLEQAKLNAHGSARETFPVLFGDNWKRAERIFYESIQKTPLSDVKPLEGAGRMLNFFHQHHIPMGVVSNKRHENLCAEINYLGWDQYFKSIVGAGIAKRDKPEPDALLMALDQADITPGLNVWFVGDTPVDWQCAKAAYCQPIAVFNQASEDIPFVQDLKALLELTQNL